MAASTDHVGLSVGDLDRITAFYCQAFGMKSTGTHVLADGQSRIALLVGPTDLCLELTQMHGSLPARPVSAAEGARIQGWFHWAVRVENLEATLGRIPALGGDIVTPPATAQTRHGVRFAYISDPEGNLIELIQTTHEARPTHPVADGTA